MGLDDLGAIEVSWPTTEPQEGTVGDRMGDPGR